MDKEEMIERIAEILRRLYYEDVEFYYGMIQRYATKKGM